MFTERDVIQYLLTRRLLDPGIVVAGDLEVINVSRRNRNLKIISTQGPSYIVKQAISQDTAATLSQEAAVYQLLLSDHNADRAGFFDHIPRFYEYGLKAGVLVLGLVRDAEDFRDYQMRNRRVSRTLASLMGKVVGTFHRLTTLDSRTLAQTSIRTQPPWVLSAHRPHLEILKDASDANVQIIRIVQNSTEFCRSLEDLYRTWVTERLIHFDIKWDNWIVLPQSASEAKPGLQLVDWELAALGDPCWDIGSVFSGYLSFWLQSIPFIGGEPTSRLLELSRFSLEQIQPACRSFWTSYVKQTALDKLEADRHLLRAIRYSAARLLQAAFEQTRDAIQLTDNIVCMLQLSANMISRPYEASVSLLGIQI